MTIHFIIDGHLSIFQIVNKTAMDICVFFLYEITGFHFGYIPELSCGVIGQIYMLNFVRKEKDSFQSICNISHFHQQCMKVSVASASLLTIGQINFLASLVGVKWSTLTVFYIWRKTPH